MQTDRSYDVIIIGAGIAGLTVASELTEAGRGVLVLERSDSVGGAIRTVAVDGYHVEEGPNSLLDTSIDVTRLLERAGLSEARLFARPEAKKRYVVRGGKPVALPMSPGQFLKTPLFSAQAKLRLLKEPFTPAWDNRHEESVADFVRRRLGQEFLDYAINPFVAGVYAGDPETLSVPHAFPKLHALEQRYGSLIRGQILGARERKQRPDSSKQSARMYSFAEGLQALPLGLATTLNAPVQTGMTVEEVVRGKDVWEVSTRTSTGDRHTYKAVSVVYAGRLTALRDLTFRDLPIQQPALLQDVYYPPVTVLGLGYKADQIGHPLDGFGVLVPQVEKGSLLGVLFSSTLFPGRAPDGHVLLTVFAGGARRPDLATGDADKLVSLVQRDLAALLDVRGHPAMIHMRRWPEAIPQYQVGYGRVKEALQLLEDGAPGLFFAGNYRAGISVPDTIKSSIEQAERINTFIAQKRS